MGINKKFLQSAITGSSFNGVLNDTDPLDEGTDTLELFLDFNGNVDDSSGHNRSQIDRGGNFYTDNVHIRYPFSYRWIDIGYGLAAGRNLSFWFNLSTATADREYCIYNNGWSSTSWTDILFSTDYSAGSVFFNVNNMTGSSAYNYKRVDISSDWNGFATWNFISVNIISGTTAEYSLNGSAFADIPTYSSLGTSGFQSNAPEFGRGFKSSGYYYGSAGYVTGNYDKARFFSKNLSDAEALRLSQEIGIPF